MIKPSPFEKSVDYLSSLVINKIDDKKYFSSIFVFQLEACNLGISKGELLKSTFDNKYILKLLNYPNEISVIVRVKNKIGIIFVDDIGFLELSEQTLDSTYGKYWYLTN